MLPGTLPPSHYVIHAEVSPACAQRTSRLLLAMAMRDELAHTHAFLIADAVCTIPGRACSNLTTFASNSVLFFALVGCAVGDGASSGARSAGGESVGPHPHAPFTHTSTSAKGWSVPTLVRFKTAASARCRATGTRCPMASWFRPPCVVVSTIGLAKPGQLEGGQTAKPVLPAPVPDARVRPWCRGETRLLYRMGLDFASWIKHVPSINHLWSYLATQVRRGKCSRHPCQQRLCRISPCSCTTCTLLSLFRLLQAFP